MDHKNTTQNNSEQKPKLPTERGVDHTLTPGQNPLPPDSEDVDTEYNKNEKVGDDKKMYANKTVKHSTPHLEEDDDEIDEDGVVD